MSRDNVRGQAAASESHKSLESLVARRSYASTLIPVESVSRGTAIFPRIFLSREILESSKTREKIVARSRVSNVLKVYRSTKIVLDVLG